MSALQVAAGDLDRDGRTDIVVVHSQGWAIYRNEGQGRFAPWSERFGLFPNSSEGQRAGATALLDLDGDGDLDVVLAWANATSRILRNAGAAGFQEAGNLPLNTSPMALVAGDVDRDGDDDLFVAGGNPVFNAGALDQLLRNDGGVLVDASQRIPRVVKNTTAAAFADIDRDGDLDLILGNAASGAGPDDEVWRNDGTGSFTLDPNALLGDTLDATDLAVGDVDADGDVDLLVVGSGPFAPWNLPVHLFRNDGTGRLRRDNTLVAPVGAARTVALFDADRDGNLDLVLGTAATLSTPPRLELRRNLGNASFGPATELPCRESPRDLATLDADGARGADLLVGTYQPRGVGAGRTQLFLNDGAGTMLDATEPLAFGPVTTNWGRGITTADLGNDGTIDLLVAVDGAIPPLRLYRNDGDGPVRDATATHVPSFTGSVLDLGSIDLDGDPYPDVWAWVFESTSSALRLWRSDAAGRLTPLPSGGVAGLNAQSVASADLDRDGRQDLIVESGTLQIWRNTGGLTWQRDTRTVLPSNLRPFVLADVDRDGFTDLVAADTSVGTQLQVWRNLGNGVLTQLGIAAIRTSQEYFTGLKAGDADGDGDVDVFALGDFSALLLNDGSGRFTAVAASQFPVPETFSTASRRGDLADVDHDGDLDVITCSLLGLEHFRNDGSGRFVDASLATFGNVDVHGLAPGFALTDFDGDGDQDVLFSQDSVVAITNLHRHTHTPDVMLRGTAARLQWFGRSGSAGNPEFLVPYLALGSSSVAIPPLGRLRLDSASLVTLPAVAIPPAAGVLTAEFNLPNQASLVGVRLHAQSLHAGPAGTPVSNWRLGNHAVSLPVR